MDTADYTRDPAGFIGRYITRTEKGIPFELADYQRRVLAEALRWDDEGLLLRLLLWGEPKKSGKTFLAACITLWWAFTRADTEVIVAANDLEQSVSRVFATAVKLLKHNPELAASCRVKAAEIVVSNGTTVKAIPSDYRGEAGARHSLAVFDELWGYDRESAQRLFEEMTPPPTEPDAWILVVTTAGFTGESVLLERLYERGLEGSSLDGELELTRADDLTMFWSRTPRQPWQTERYYEQQRRLLRPNTYKRLHQNEWVVAEAVFITPELLDPCVDPGIQPMLLDKSDVPLWVGVDAGIKSDNAAVVAVTVDGDDLVLATHRVWKPSKAEPLDIEASIERFLRELCKGAKVERIVCDPYQLHRSITTLRREGLPIEEYPQTLPNLTAAGQALYDLLRSRRLRLYRDQELRQQALNTVAVESPRGWRIAKEKASKKIDAIVALAMACKVAMERPKKLTRATWGDTTTRPGELFTEAQKRNLLKQRRAFAVMIANSR